MTGYQNAHSPMRRHRSRPGSACPARQDLIPRADTGVVFDSACPARKNHGIKFESNKNKKETHPVNMKGHIDNKMGSIQIDPEVIAMYAGTTAVECFGIVGMAAVSMKDGLVRLLKKESLTHGINVTIKDNALSIDFHVIVAYGVSISTVADNLIESVKYKVEEFTGMKVEKINIYVEGVRVID